MTAPNKRQLFLSARVQSILRWSRYFFFLVGIVALGYCAYVLIDTRLYQAYQSGRFQQAIQSSNPPASSGRMPPASRGVSPAPVERLASAGRADFPLGRIEISRIGLAAMIMEGSDHRTLRRAVGHIPGTALPGQQGNVALTGHRDTIFRPLLEIREGDEITLTTLDGSYGYRVDSISVVDPGDLGVLDDTGDAVLTLVTCYPFYFVGPAPKRFIVRAHRIPG